MEVREQVCSPWWRIKIGVTRRSGGSGKSCEVVQLHGGVDLKSEAIWKDVLFILKLFSGNWRDLLRNKHDFNAPILSPPFFTLIGGHGLVFTITCGGE